MFNCLLKKIKRLLKKLDLKEDLLLYIGGGESLPSPFSPEEESEKLKRLSSGDEKVKEEATIYSSRVAFQKGSYGAYSYALKHKMLDELFPKKVLSI